MREGRGTGKEWERGTVKGGETGRVRVKDEKRF